MRMKFLYSGIKKAQQASDPRRHKIMKSEKNLTFFYKKSNKQEPQASPYHRTIWHKNNVFHFTQR